jgi:hypothetical protein
MPAHPQRPKVTLHQEEGGLTKSFITLFTLSLICVPRTKMACFSFSTSLGSVDSRCRLERAFFGLLGGDEGECAE